MKKPNVIFIFSDQHRKSSMGFWQNDEYKDYIKGEPDPVITPNLDELARDGVVLSEAYSSYPVCSPFRAMLFSGRYPENNGVWNNCAPGRLDALREDLDSLTDVLSDSGYSVGYVGKWHLEEPRPDFDSEGNYIGDDENYKGERFFPDGSPDSNTACWDTLIRSGRQRKIDYLYAYNTWDVFRTKEGGNKLKAPHYWDKDHNRITVPPNIWSPEFETDLALDFIKNEKGERDEDKPYALFVSYNPPHLPYSSREDTDYTAYDNIYSADNQPDINALIKRENVTITDKKFHEKVRVYFSHVTGIDSCVGKILDGLEKSGEKDNTIVIFTADHGEMLGSHGLMSKNVPYEEATAIPFIIRYPDMLKHRTDDLFMTGADIMPTLLGLIDVDIPRGVEGSDYSTLLKGEDGERPRSALFTQPKRKGVRTAKYLLTISYGDKDNYSAPELYDLENDPYQMSSIPFDSIPEEELTLLREELGLRLKISGDPWYKMKLYHDFIIYPIEA